MATEGSVVWKDIPGYEGLYQASNLGDIRGVKRQGSQGGVLSPAKRKDGYLQVSLRKDGEAKSHLTHRLIASAFLEYHEDKNYVNHIDGDRANNSVENLEYCTHQENCIHRHYALNKNVKPVVCVETGVEYPSIREAERQTGVGSKEILNCCKGRKRYRTAGGFRWRYKGGEDVG